MFKQILNEKNRCKSMDNDTAKSYTMELEWQVTGTTSLRDEFRNKTLIERGDN